MYFIRGVDRIFFGRVNDRIFRERIKLCYKFDLRLAEYSREQRMAHNVDGFVADIIEHLKQTYKPEGSCPEIEMYNLASPSSQREYDQIHWRICNTISS